MKVYRIWDTEKKVYIKTFRGKTFWNSHRSAASARTFHYQSRFEIRLDLLKRFEVHEFELKRILE